MWLPGSSYVGALRRPVEKEDEEDDGESDSEIHGDMLAARQINGDSEAEDEVSGGGGGGQDDDDDDNGDDEAASSGLGAGGGDVAAATADERPKLRRSDRAQRFQGAMVEVRVHKFAHRPKLRKKRPSPSKRKRDRVKNHAHYAAKT